MDISKSQRRTSVVDKLRVELPSLTARGVMTAGNALSSVLLLKGEPSKDELSCGKPLCGQDGTALRAALSALGYPPEDWCALLTVQADGTPLPSDLLREAVCVLDPATLIICDEAATQAMREAYASELVQLDDFTAALLADGEVVQLLGMRVMSLGGFEAALESPHEKQVMWRRLKQLPPLGEPY